MNEYSILFYLLSKTSPNADYPDFQQLGESEEKICEALKYTGKVAHIRFQRILEEFSRNVQPFGLIIRKNPFNNCWFLIQSSEIQEFFHANPFEDKNRLPATLCIIIALALTQSDSISIDKIKELRKKKDITEDLETLEDLNFIIIEENRVYLHPNLGYFLNFETFLEDLAKKSQFFNGNNK